MSNEVDIQKENEIRVGMLFERRIDDDAYIVAHVGNNKVALINLETGYSHGGHVTMGKHTYITPTIWGKICGQEQDDFVKLPVKSKVHLTVHND